MAFKKEYLTCNECSRLKLPVKTYPRDELVYIAENRKLCPTHYAEYVKTKKFNDFVCELFGIRSAGPRIYTQRKRLHDQGYTDETIMHTLEYCFKVKRFDKTEESLGLVPHLADEAYAWWREQKNKVVELKEVKKEEKVVSIQKKEKKKQLLDFDFLNDDEEE